VPLYRIVLCFGYMLCSSPLSLAYIHVDDDGVKCVAILEHLLCPRSLKVKTSILHYNMVNIICMQCCWVSMSKAHTNALKCQVLSVHYMWWYVHHSYLELLLPPHAPIRLSLFAEIWDERATTLHCLCIRVATSLVLTPQCSTFT